MKKYFYLRMMPGTLAILITCLVQAQNLLNPHTQPKFVNPLPIPATVDARAGGNFNFYITQFLQNLGLFNPVTGLPMMTTVWGYNGTYPGPTILAKKNIPVNAFWYNNLVNSSNQPLPHLLPIDTSVHWALEGYSDWQQRGVPVVTHLHGGHTESASDGLPDAWFTPNFALKGMGFVKGDISPYHYDNSQEAATIWYHDHALGITRLNVYMGLAGYYIITDDNEIGLQNTNKLPAAPYDLGLAIQDRMFTSNGELYYPVNEEDPEDPHPGVLPEFFGDFILVNGKAWPVLEVEPRPYRFRILNGSDSRFYNLYLSSGQTITQIGTDNGLLPSPLSFSKVLIGTGERKDVIIDFSDPALWGQTIIMQNNAKTPFPKGAAPNPQTTGKIMAFKVVKPLDTSYPLTTLPATLRPPITPLQTSLPPRQLLLFEGEDEYDRLKPMLGTVEHGVLGFHEPITENPALNSTEIWEVYNATMDAHTLHLHMVTMQLINRQKVKIHADEETGKPSKIHLIGNPRLPGAEEMGWKDTYIMFPGEVTRIITHFDREGLYVWHCHILSHEDHEMMRPYFVGNMAGLIMKEDITDAKDESVYNLKMMPNPFNSDLRIQLQLNKTENVVINIYNAKGSLVKKVYSGKAGEGTQQYNVEGTGWSNGTYFAEIVIGKERIVRKLILQR